MADKGNMLNEIVQDSKITFAVDKNENGAGSLAAEAEKSVQSWEGALNRLSNTWTDTVGNIAESDAVVGAVNGLNDVLSVVLRRNQQHAFLKLIKTNPPIKRNNSPVGIGGI